MTAEARPTMTPTIQARPPSYPELRGAYDDEDARRREAKISYLESMMAQLQAEIDELKAAGPSRPAPD